MPRYEHIHLVRVAERLPRRKQRGFGGTPARDHAQHSNRLQAELSDAIAQQARRRKPAFTDPALILRVQMTGSLQEEEWEKVGLTVLGTNPDRTLVLFASDSDLQEFKQRLTSYQQGAPPDQKNPAYNAFVAAIERIGSIGPSDRIGPRLKAAGTHRPEDLSVTETYTFDVELWDLGSRNLRANSLAKIRAWVKAEGGEAFGEYNGPSIALIRIHASGAVMRALLDVEEIAAIDLPPKPDIAAEEAYDWTLGDAPARNELPADAPRIGIIDSGVNLHPFIADIVDAAIGVPAELGIDDEYGHGTRVAGVAAFGDLRAQISAGTLTRAARLCSAKVTNSSGNFDDREVIAYQMREAITTLHHEFGCRIFVVAVADSTLRYTDTKVGIYAATLDELARELDVVIVVAAGNRWPRSGDALEEAVTAYPAYLLEDENRSFEPAGALNVLTVGSLAHGNGLDPQRAADVGIIPITEALEPSPFSCVGPGAENAIKPDLVDIGGTLLFDPGLRTLHRGKTVPSAGVLTLHHQFLNRLFASGSGTSYSAPKVAFKAAQVLRQYPQASANLVRALLAISAEIPPAARERLASMSEDDARRICGYGQCDLLRASFSDDARVVFYVEDELAIDHFAVYRVPIPDIYQTSKGDRQIRVALAFDPPVRHTRIDYAGVGMSFRLIRGCSADFVFEHYRTRAQSEGDVPELEGRYNCDLRPKPRAREGSSLQCATVEFKRNVSGYGDEYFLVVRCEGGWAREEARQKFALVVELLHRADIQLYARLQERIRIRT